MLEADPGHLGDPALREAAEDAGRQKEISLELGEQVEAERLAREQIVPDAGLPVELPAAALGIEYLVTDDLADRVGEVVRELGLRLRHREPGAKGPVSVLADREVVLFAPEGLEEAGALLELVVGRNDDVVLQKKIGQAVGHLEWNGTTNRTAGGG